MGLEIIAIAAITASMSIYQGMEAMDAADSNKEAAEDQQRANKEAEMANAELLANRAAHNQKKLSASDAQARASLSSQQAGSGFASSIGSPLLAKANLSRAQDENRFDVNAKSNEERFALRQSTEQAHNDLNNQIYQFEMAKRSAMTDMVGGLVQTGVSAYSMNSNASADKITMKEKGYEKSWTGGWKKSEVKIK